jgi:hypothetical protein
MPRTVFTGLLSLFCLAILAACQAASIAEPVARPDATSQSNAPSPAPTSVIAPGLSMLHTVQAGENLFRIAQEYGVSLNELARINNIADPAQITAGQKLTIPLGTQPDPATATSTSTPMPTPTNTPAPALPTRLPSSTPTPGGPPTATPVPPTSVNNIAIDQFVIMPPAVQANMRKIFAAGQALGRNARAYSKVGDSTIENPHFMMRFDSGPYNLGQYAYLQDIINVYLGSHARESIAVHRGIHSWSLMNPVWADKDQCEPNEGPLPCEIRLHNPSVAIFRLGSNDVGVPALFKQSMQDAITYCIQQGVIPIIGTKADRHEGEGNINNNILRELAAGNNLPLWDFDIVAQTLPNGGIDPVDGTHMTFYFAHDYTDPIAFTKGHAVHNLTALIMLDRARKVLNP